MLLRNRCSSPVYWRTFNHDDLVLIIGLAEGIVPPNGSMSYNHPSSDRFKIEVKRDGAWGPFLTTATVYFNVDEIEVDANCSTVGRVIQPQPQPQPQAVTLSSKLLRVVTWNLGEGYFGANAARGNADSGWGPAENSGIAPAAEIIRSENPDIVLLNEVMYWRGFPFSLGGSLLFGRNQVEELRNLTQFPFWQYIEVNGLGFSGIKLLGILSRFDLGPWSKIQVIPNWALMQSPITVKGQKINLFSFRLPPRIGDPLDPNSDFFRHRSSIDPTVTALRSLPPGEAVIFGGDLNSGPGELEFDLFRANCGCNLVGPAIIRPSPMRDFIFTRHLQSMNWDEYTPPNNPSDHSLIRAEIPVPGPFEARYGRKVKLRHAATAQMLHSHPINYSHPGSSRQQQVTARYGYDDNDFWIIKAPHGSPLRYREGQPVLNGEIVRLEHALTRRNLHSHGPPHRSPVTGQQETTCFGNQGEGDSNDDWRVEVQNGQRVVAGESFRLVHVATNAALHSHRGHSHLTYTAGQQEVTGYAGRDDNDFWYLCEIE